MDCYPISVGLVYRLIFSLMFFKHSQMYIKWLSGNCTLCPLSSFVMLYMNVMI